MPVALVTGASRGLGLEHCRAFARRGWDVIAGARRPDCQGLRDLVAGAGGRVRAMALDVTDHACVDRLAASLRGTAIDVLVNNAGSSGPEGGFGGAAYQSLSQMDYAIWREILEVNLLGAFRVATALREHVAASARRLIVNMSSDLGSIAQNRRGNLHAYRTSKAGLNMVTRGMAIEWQDLVVVAMAPGWCRTDLGGEGAEVEPADSVREQQAVLERLGPADSGRFIDRFGRDVPW
jgi:NAD(P)-dependent dehydrogenase (short-subunit alcohol dehydrogenase family)